VTHPDIENTFTKANESKKNIRYVIVGGRGFLDLKDRSILRRKSTCFSYRISPFEDDRNHYYWIIGDYFGVSTLDVRTAKKIDDIYDKTRKESDISSIIRSSLLSQKCRGSVKCEWAPEKAEKMRSKFTTFFNIKLRDNGELLTQRAGEV
jgi:hypothetical protein